MTWKPVLAVVACVGGIVPVPAFAQESDTVVGRVMPISIESIRGGDFVRGRYEERAGRTVYSIGVPADTGGDYRSSGTNTYDDVTFPEWAVVNGSMEINGIGLGFIVPVTATEDHLCTCGFRSFPNTTIGRR